MFKPDEEETDESGKLDLQNLEDLMAFAKGGMRDDIKGRYAPPPEEMPPEGEEASGEPVPGEEPIPGVEEEEGAEGGEGADVEKLKAILAKMKGG